MTYSRSHLHPQSCPDYLVISEEKCSPMTRTEIISYSPAISYLILDHRRFS